MHRKLSSSAEIFTLAAKVLVSRMPYGSQGLLAKSMGVRDGYLSDLLKGKRNWSDRLRDKFAHAIGMSVVEIYAIGDGINTTGVFFPYSTQVQDTPPHSSVRAAKIMLCVMRELKFHLEVIASPAVIEAINSDIFREYSAGRLSDGDYYRHVRETILKSLSDYTPKK